MKIKLSQNHQGKFYLGNPNKQHCFQITIVDNDGRLIDSNGVKAVLEIMDEESEDWWIYNDWRENFHEIVMKCLKWSYNTIGTTNYKERANLFIKLYHENFTEIQKNLHSELKSMAQKKIKEYEAIIKYENCLPDISWEVKNICSEKIDYINRIIETNEENLKDIKPESNKYKEDKAYIDKKKLTVNSYQETVDIIKKWENEFS